MAKSSQPCEFCWHSTTWALVFCVLPILDALKRTQYHGLGDYLTAHGSRVHGSFFRVARASRFRCSCWGQTRLLKRLETTVNRFRYNITPGLFALLKGNSWLRKFTQCPGNVCHFHRPDAGVKMDSCWAMYSDVLATSKYHLFQAANIARFANATLSPSPLVTEYCPIGFLMIMLICANLRLYRSFQFEIASEWRSKFGTYTAVYMEAMIKMHALWGVDECLHDGGTWSMTSVEVSATYANWLRRFELRDAFGMTWTSSPSVANLLREYQSRVIGVPISLQPRLGTLGICPEGPEVLGESSVTHIAHISVSCSVVAVWPEEREAMEDFEQFLRPHCDHFAAFVALQPNGASGKIPHATMPPDDWSVVDLSVEFPDVIKPDIWDEIPNNVQKFFMMIRYLAARSLWQQKSTIGSGQDWWFCILETDVVFIPENFKRFIALRELDSSKPLWIGAPRLDSLLSSGVLLEPMQGSCMSHDALVRLAAFVESFMHAKVAEGMAPMIEVWPPTEMHRCDPLATEAFTEVLEIVNACLRAVGVYSLDPHLAHDHRGRMYFSLYPFDRVTWLGTAPPLAPYPQHVKYTDLPMDQQPNYINWNGKEYLYVACLRAGQRTWFADYPIMFHGHIRHSLACRERQGRLLKKTNLHPSTVHRILRGEEPCPASVCGDYAPKVYSVRS